MNDLSQYKAVILCGGQGTRIRGVADNVPKPLVEVGGRPILWHIMKIYSFYGVRKFVLCLGYKGNAIIEYFENYHARTHDFTINIKDRIKYFDQSLDNGSKSDIDVNDWEITFAHTGVDTMTGGRLKRIENYIDEDLFFCTYGDGLSDVNIKEVYQYHREKGKTATLIGVHLPTTFGVVESDDDGIIRKFREKPVLPGLINGGFFVFDKKIFDYIDDDQTVLEEAPFRRLVRDEEAALFKYQGFWRCMDTFKDYSTLNAMWKEKQTPWRIW